MTARSDDNVTDENIYAIFKHAARRFPDNDAVVFEDRAVSYAELDRICPTSRCRGSSKPSTRFPGLRPSVSGRWNCEPVVSRTRRSTSGDPVDHADRPYAAMVIGRWERRLPPPPASRRPS
jgi:hypothetical protein